VVEALGGLRETPKFLLVQAFDHVRTRALAEADALLAAGRLDARDDVFWLTFEELGAGLADASIDLRAQVKAHRDELRRLQGRTEPPRFLDSRGRILRPAPPPLREGELAGHPISPGVVRGRVKVLHAPDEKPLLPGEVLVARATDPGWTPLFVNAVAVVLEVGGVMQHGALVAREYGRACVAGVEGATTRLRDGELVEVDGSAGTVRRVTG
jgi:pyruvate,water dikinase